jgi:hypothetical protein
MKLLLVATVLTTLASGLRTKASDEAHMTQMRHDWSEGEQLCDSGKCWMGCAFRQWCWTGRG